MNQEETSLWQAMTAEQRQRVIAILVQMLLRQITEKPGEVSDERGE